MRITQLAADRNLQLAWRRISTGDNQQYKRFFREMYVTYEIALTENLRDLRRRLVAGTFEPQAPERVYLPKASGLHRPLSVLHLEDQIVLQAFANLAASRVHRKRTPLLFTSVFSNILQRKKSIFFFKRWQETYSAFQRRIRSLYSSGLRWVADFDLAAFYDTVSHDLLLKTIYPRTTGDLAWFRDCLGTWSSENATSRHGHGIPQGPLASDFLAECFLLPIDAALNKTPGYVRYVDDVRLFGKSEDEVRAAVIQLERHCREHGLIPQSGKFAIKHARSLDEAMGFLPSIGDPHRTSPGSRKRAGLSKSRAKSLFIAALGGRPYRVQEKSRLRYVLYRADPDPDLLRLSVRLIPHHPEHADAFFNYLGTFDQRASVLRLCLELLETSPYPYVRGEAWVALTRYLDGPLALSAGERTRLSKLALRLTRGRRPENFTETLGACQFLCASQTSGRARYGRFLRGQPALLQAIVAPLLPDEAFAPGEVAVDLLRSREFEPGLAIAGRLLALRLKPSALGVPVNRLSSQMKNTLSALGTLVVPGARGQLDAIAEILERRYGVISTRSWHALLAGEYAHCLGLLKQAEAAFSGGMSYWLASQNSFHHAIFIALQKHFAATGHAGATTLVGRDGKLVDFGVMLAETGPFSTNCALIAGCFRDMNSRRNHLPISHPYDKKTQVRTKHLTAQERTRFVKRLRAVYPAFEALLP